MLSIGEIAHRTGVSRRMLRHWEQQGLIEPARTDPATGYRRYEPTQVGRVNAVATLRDSGFGLEDIRVLLDPALGRGGLESVLRAQERDLVQQIDEATVRLTRVRHRLDTLETRAREVAMNITRQSLPSLSLRGLQASVRDETDIPAAVTQLRERLGGDIEGAAALALVFDGTDDDQITVTVGFAHSGETAEGTGDASVAPITIAGVEDGVSVHFVERPSDVSDAWVVIDSHLETVGLHSYGVYRQLVAADGAVTLQAGVRPLPPDCASPGA